MPKGTYITGTLDLGNASLYLEKGAVLMGSGDWADYRPNGFVHNEMHDTISLIYSMNSEDITISDEGTIDLNAEAFYSKTKNFIDDGCVIYGSQRGICFMASKGTGLVEHVLIDNVRIETKIRAGNWWGNGEPICFIGTYHNYDGYLNKLPVRGWDVNIRDIKLTNISCSSENYIGVIGQDDNIRDVTFRDVTFEMLESKNRYLKGDRRIDISLTPGEMNVPEDFDGFIYTHGCKDVKIINAEFMK